jgi:hypothetical protein
MTKSYWEGKRPKVAPSISLGNSRIYTSSTLPFLGENYELIAILPGEGETRIVAHLRERGTQSIILSRTFRVRADRGGLWCSLNTALNHIMKGESGPPSRDRQEAMRWKSSMEDTIRKHQDQLTLTLGGKDMERERQMKMSPETWAALALADGEYIPERPTLSDEQVRTLLSSAEAEGLIPARTSASAEAEAILSEMVTPSVPIGGTLL